jgi:hypothetical protein
MLLSTHVSAEVQAVWQSDMTPPAAFCVNPNDAETSCFLTKPTPHSRKSILNHPGESLTIAPIYSHDAGMMQSNAL